MSGKRQEHMFVQRYSGTVMHQPEMIEKNVRDHFPTPNALKLHTLIIRSGNLIGDKISVHDESHDGDRGTFHHGLAPLRETRYSASQMNELLQPLGVDASIHVHPAVETYNGLEFGTVRVVDVEEGYNIRRDGAHPHVTTIMTLYPNREILQLIQDYQTRSQVGIGEYNKTLHQLQRGMTYDQLAQFTSNPQQFVENMRQLLK